MTRDENAEFWGQQEEEHLLFFSLLFNDPDLVAQAKDLHARYADARKQPLPVLEAATREARAWHKIQLARLNAGEYLGSVYPLFMDHTTREVDIMLYLVWGDPPPPLGLPAAVTELGAEHALFAMHLLDPSERILVAEANAAADGLYGDALGLTEGKMIYEPAAQKNEQLKAWLLANGIGHGGAKSIVAPTLADHVVREQDYFAATLRGE